jgi:two-component system alkaline phosphatase synthesis response regulator PhoP
MADVTILAVDPDPSLLGLIRRHVTLSGHRFCGARGGEDAIRKARMIRPDGMILRARLPDMSARDLVARLCEDADAARSGLRVPVLLTARRGQEEDVSAGLEQGAENVLFLPFEPADFAEQLEGLLRRTARPAEETVLHAGPVSVDLEKGALLRPDPQPLTASELEILRCLLNPPGRAVTRRQVASGAERAVDVHVASLRSKLGEAGPCIETIRGVGYRFRGAGVS